MLSIQRQVVVDIVNGMTINLRNRLSARDVCWAARSLSDARWKLNHTRTINLMVLAEDRISPTVRTRRVGNG